ncbi:MAG: hypothetical protein II222_07305 [Paraprevotella sp.]|nr:hypothetical protein [Paraprevotella sp.]
MKTLRLFGAALVAVVLSLGMSSCDDDEETIPYVNPYQNYAQLIVGKWFNFTPEASMFLNYQTDGTKNVIGWDYEQGWIEMTGTYRLEGNKLIEVYKKTDGTTTEILSSIELTNDKLIHKEGVNSGTSTLGERVHYRVQESFDIKGNYTYLNSLAKVEAVEGKTVLQLPEGVNYKGQNFIPVDAMHGERIIAAMQKFFEDATFAENGALMHTMDGEAKTKNYSLNGNDLTFNLYEGSEIYNVNATSFPDEDGDRLFIIIPKQAAWLGGMVDLVEKENPGLTLNEAQIAQLEQEFMSTFKTFTVVLSLSKK